MSWLSEQGKRGRNPRTYALLALLAATLLFVRYLDQGEKDARLRAGTAGGPPAAQLATMPAKPGGRTPTPPGWGSDPFRTRLGGPAVPGGHP